MKIGGFEVRCGTEAGGQENWLRVAWHHHRAPQDSPAPEQQIILPQHPREFPFRGYSSPSNSREAEQALADLPPSERRRVLFEAATNEPTWGIPVFLTQVFAIVLTLGFLGAVLGTFIAVGDVFAWMELWTIGLPMALRTGLVLVIIYGLLRWAAVRFAKVKPRHVRDAWVKLYGDGSDD